MNKIENLTLPFEPKLEYNGGKLERIIYSVKLNNLDDSFMFYYDNLHILTSWFINF